MRERKAARVLVFNERGELLMVRGHDADRPERSWWFTIGGGIEANETPREAAARELFEESGIRYASGDLVGPVMLRSAVFDFEAEHVLQHEEFFLAHVDSATVLSRDGWTELERSFVDDLRWLSVAELRTSAIEVFPHQLAQIVEKLFPNWDGNVMRLDTETNVAHVAAQ